MHTNVRASHDRGRMTVGDGNNCIDDNLVFLGGGTRFAIISLRDAHGRAESYSEAHLSTLRGYGFFVEATIDEALSSYEFEGDNDD